jgi:hypothetical protein
VHRRVAGKLAQASPMAAAEGAPEEVIDNVVPSDEMTSSRTMSTPCAARAAVIAKSAPGRSVICTRMER